MSIRHELVKMGPRNENMPEGLKDRTECGRIWSIGRCCFGRDWNKTKIGLLPHEAWESE